MKINVNLSAVASTLVIVAVVSLFIMVALTRIDNIVHSVLYDYGLRFSYRWATPYWVYSVIIVGASWFNIAASIGLIVHFLRRRKRSQALEGVQAEGVREVKQQHRLVEYVEPRRQETVDLARISPQQSREAPAEELVEQPKDFIEAQIREERAEIPELQIKKYDVRHPEDVVDSQC